MDTNETKKAALNIITAAIRNSLPYENTKKLLLQLDLPQSVTVFSIGKAAIPMAQAAAQVLGDRIKTGIVVTKYGHTGDFSSPYFEVTEAAHPVSDENSILAAEKCLAAAHALGADDTAVVLLSGGGSALLEKSTVDPRIQRDVTQKLLARGADIEQINAIRKRLSLVKGGKLAAACYPAKVITIALSDVLSNAPGVIASGITVADTTPDDFVRAVAQRYLPDAPQTVHDSLYTCAPLRINDGGYYFAGDINSLVEGAASAAEKEGFNALVVSRSVTGEAKDRAKEIIAEIKAAPKGTALICGGETTVTLKGNGKGGRNQEMALAAALALDTDGSGIVFASCGSDGTDGPTDAAGGIADGQTCEKIKAAGLDPTAELENNNSYFALKAADCLITTGATGTNVNDITIAIKR